MTILAAYPLSRPDLPGRNAIMVFITLTMFFSGGLIPTYLLVKDLGMVDSMWALIVPGAIAIQSDRDEDLFPIEHSLGVRRRPPISTAVPTGGRFSVSFSLYPPILAVMVLFYAVGHWNSFFNALIYIRNENLHPLQLVLREILLISQSDAVDGGVGLEESILLAESIKYAVIIVSSLPVLLMYPFVRRHFVKGVMIGSIKG